MNTPNAALAYALSATDWSNRELARRLNSLAVQRGHRGIAIDHTRVGRWIRRGEKPRTPLPELLADLFTERLGCRYTPQMLGLTSARRFQVHLAEAELATLLRRAAKAQLPVKDYLSRLVSTALAQDPNDEGSHAAVPSE
ncbi:hypothetical protein [Streptomyces sp. SP17KL33]|uniref:hypothetical protein n=1 Tax=Streptomyces sp. SP17KL33 TaxID=3002534 RepID=UPI002E78D716|nr:hypothetical protein [Streptomyces sp. SP17KL33]MEE1829700.1 hypothetical protein [Streptomyces sp. SP17KL33]